MRKLVCSCAIAHEGKEDEWQEDLEVYLEDSEGDPKRATPEQINNAALREVQDIITSFNRVEENRAASFGIEPKPRYLKGMIVKQNRAY